MATPGKTFSALGLRMGLALVGGLGALGIFVGCIYASWAYSPLLVWWLVTRQPLPSMETMEDVVGNALVMLMLSMYATALGVAVGWWLEHRWYALCVKVGTWLPTIPR